MSYAQQLAPPLAVAAAVAVAAESRSPRPDARLCWAKKLTGKKNHKDVIAEQAMEMSIRSLSPASSTSQPTTNIHKQNALNHIGNNISSSKNLPAVDLWSPLGGSSSSEESNSPTDLNSCKQIKDKPPLLKNLEVVQENILEDNIAKDISRPSSGGYINDRASWNGTSVSRVSSVSDGTKMKQSYYSSRKRNKFSLSYNGHLPSAPPTDEDFLLESSSSTSSKRSSHSSCDQNTLSDGPEVGQNRKQSSQNSSTSNSNLSLTTPPPPPERHDSLSITLSEERELRGAPWFQAGIPREIALEILSQEPVGSFMVRESTSKPGCFALSLRVPQNFHQSGIAHYLIMRTNRGYKIKGFTKEFVTLTALITHHSVMPELLPCPLSLSRHNPTFKKHDSEDMVDMNEDPDYNLLSDFRKMLSDVNV